jgi:hypothetical protein
MAIGQSQLAGRDYLEVSERLFRYLTKDPNTKSLTYGSPGIKVYVKGTREEIERLERMSVEQYNQHLVSLKKKQ